MSDKDKQTKPDKSKRPVDHLPKRESRIHTTENPLRCILMAQ